MGEKDERKLKSVNNLESLRDQITRTVEYSDYPPDGAASAYVGGGSGFIDFPSASP